MNAPILVFANFHCPLPSVRVQIRHFEKLSTGNHPVYELARFNRAFFDLLIINKTKQSAEIKEIIKAAVDSGNPIYTANDFITKSEMGAFGMPPLDETLELYSKFIEGYSDYFLDKHQTVPSEKETDQAQGAGASEKTEQVPVKKIALKGILIGDLNLYHGGGRESLGFYPGEPLIRNTVLGFLSARATNIIFRLQRILKAGHVPEPLEDEAGHPVMSLGMVPCSGDSSPEAQGRLRAHAAYHFGGDKAANTLVSPVGTWARAREALLINLGYLITATPTGTPTSKKSTVSDASSGAAAAGAGTLDSPAASPVSASASSASASASPPIPPLNRSDSLLSERSNSPAMVADIHACDAVAVVSRGRAQSSVTPGLLAAGSDAATPSGRPPRPPLLKMKSLLVHSISPAPGQSWATPSQFSTSGLVSPAWSDASAASAAPPPISGASFTSPITPVYSPVTLVASREELMDILQKKSGPAGAGVDKYLDFNEASASASSTPASVSAAVPVPSALNVGAKTKLLGSKPKQVFFQNNAQPSQGSTKQALHSGVEEINTLNTQPVEKGQDGSKSPAG